MTETAKRPWTIKRGAGGYEVYDADGQFLANFNTEAHARLFAAGSGLVEALEESVKLQSHYAGILNDYDGGKRLQFADAQAWLDRLTALSKLTAKE